MESPPFVGARTRLRPHPARYHLQVCAMDTPDPDAIASYPLPAWLPCAIFVDHTTDIFVSARPFGIARRSVLGFDTRWNWEMALLDRITRWFRTEPIATIEALEAFADSRAAFMAQKCVFEYCRARSGVLSMKLFKEQAFMDAMHHSRWTTYALVYCDVAEMIEGVLRPHARGSLKLLADGLARMGEHTFACHGLPEGAPDDFWKRAVERLEKRLALAQLHAPRPVRDIPKTEIEAVLASLPIHPSLRGQDFELLQNNLRINLVRIYEEFLAGADLEELGAVLSPESAEVDARAALHDASHTV
jgi:hypothetical protein